MYRRVVAAFAASMLLAAAAFVPVRCGILDGEGVEDHESVGFPVDIPEDLIKGELARAREHASANTADTDARACRASRPRRVLPRRDPRGPEPRGRPPAA